MTMQLEDGDERADINDPCVPDEVRDHGRRFKKPARYVIDLGNDEFILYAEDGELLDLVSLT